MYKIYKTTPFIRYGLREEGVKRLRRDITITCQKLFLHSYVSSHMTRPKLLLFHSSFRRGVDVKGGKTSILRSKP